MITNSDYVLYEELFASSGAFNPRGIEVIGVIKYICEFANIPYVSQKPTKMAAAYKWNGTSRFINLNFIDSIHSRDAAMHGLAYLGVNKVA